MWNKIKIFEIRKDALLSLRKNYNGHIVKKKWVVILYYYVLPIIISLTLLSVGKTIDSDTANYFITGISIFAGLFFNLLLIVADKLHMRKRLLSSDDNEEKQNYITRFHNFSEQLISQISYNIIIAIFLIVLMFLTHTNNWELNLNVKFCHFISIGSLIDYILNGTIFILGSQFIIILFVILSSMYVMLIDDLKLEN